MSKWLIIGIVAGIFVTAGGIGVFLAVSNQNSSRPTRQSNQTNNTYSTQEQPISQPEQAPKSDQPAQQPTNPSATQGAPPLSQSSAQPATTSPSIRATQTAQTNPSEPPLKLKSIGINLDYYDSATGKAGDLVFTKEKLQFGVLFTEFGFTIPGNQSATGQDKRNPQPTFQAPLGTKVQSLVDGVVIDIPKLYSDDYSIMVGPDSSSQWRYETEHVINPLVKVGDTVKAGQVIAQVSPHNNQANAGYGLVEIGILKGGNPPEHLCPFAYLDDSIKNDILAKLKAFYKSWEDYRGDSSLYNEDGQPTLGCLTLDPIEG